MLTLRRNDARRLPAAALATALFVFAAPLASLWHEATVRHVTCLEHGELVDAAPLTAAELGAPEHHHARTVFERGQSAPDDLGDVHCVLTSWHHERSTAAGSSPLLARPQPAVSHGLTAVPDRRPSAIPLYALAPKLSPPLA